MSELAEVVYKFRGFTADDMDELDAFLYRSGVDGKPDFNKMTWTVKKFPPGWASFDQKQLDHYCFFDYSK